MRATLDPCFNIFQRCKQCSHCTVDDWAEEDFYACRMQYDLREMDAFDSAEAAVAESYFINFFRNRVRDGQLQWTEVKENSLFHPPQSCPFYLEWVVS